MYTRRTVLADHNTYYWYNQGITEESRDVEEVCLGRAQQGILNRL